MKWLKRKGIIYWLLQILTGIIYFFILYGIGYRKKEMGVAIVMVIITLSTLFLIHHLRIVHSDMKIRSLYEEDKRKYDRHVRELSKEYRHDQMNIIQVISGYLQLKNVDKAMDEIKKIKRINHSITRGYKLKIAQIPYLIDKKIREAVSHGIEIEMRYSSQLTGEAIRYVEPLQEARVSDFLNLMIDSMRKENKRNGLIIDIDEREDTIQFTFQSNLIEDFREEVLQSLKGINVIENKIILTIPVTKSIPYEHE